MKAQQLYLKPEEATFLSMAVVSTLELLQENAKDQTIHFNPEARKDLRDMISAGKGLQIKMKNLGIDTRPLPPYTEGDEDEFLTKQS